MTVTYRQGSVEDTRIAFDIFKESIMDLGDRIGVQAITNGDDPAVIENLWKRRRPLFEHLSRTAEHFWIAERDGQAIGFARAILRDGVRELTDFFVLPGQQSAGVGRDLLARAFPQNDARHRIIIATTDSRATARYLKAGVYPRFPIYYFQRKAEIVDIDTDLAIQPIGANGGALDILNRIDAEVIGFKRQPEHEWMLESRQGLLYLLRGQPVGYGYVGSSNGPFALLDAADYPAVLAHAERLTHADGGSFGIEVPLINTHAVDYLLGRGFQMDTFFTRFMSDASFGNYANYIFTSPPFFT